MERGREDLGKAQDFKKKALKKKILCLGLVVVAVIIILLGKRTLRTSLDIKGLLSVRSNLELPSNAKPVKLLNFIKYYFNGGSIFSDTLRVRGIQQQ